MTKTLVLTRGDVAGMLGVPIDFGAH